MYIRDYLIQFGLECEQSVGNKIQSEALYNLIRENIVKLDIYDNIYSLNLNLITSSFEDLELWDKVRSIIQWIEFRSDIKELKNLIEKNKQELSTTSEEVRGLAAWLPDKNDKTHCLAPEEELNRNEEETKKFVETPCERLVSWLLGEKTTEELPNHLNPGNAGKVEPIFNVGQCAKNLQGDVLGSIVAVFSTTKQVVIRFSNIDKMSVYDYDQLDQSFMDKDKLIPFFTHDDPLDDQEDFGFYNPVDWNYGANSL